MTRYYFETKDDDVRFVDKEGTDLQTAEAASDMALEALPDMLRDHMADSRNKRTFSSIVWDDKGKKVFEGTLTLEGVWLA